MNTNSNLLLSDAAPPVAGINYGDAVMWYGGDLNVTVTGVFDGATVELLACTKLPDQSLVANPPGAGQVATYAELFSDTDWVQLGSYNAIGEYKGPLNPCLLAVKISNPGAATAVRVVLN